MTDLIEWSPVKVKLSALTFWADNPKTLTKAQAAKLEGSTKKLGRAGMLSVGPAFADGKRDLYDGHQRAAIWRTLYGADFEVWCLEASRALTVDERKNVAVLMAVAVGSFDWDKLSGWENLQSYGLDSALLADWKRDTAALSNFIGSEEIDYEKEWEGMPEFTDEPDAVRSLYVHFETDDDFQNFCVLIGQKLTEKTKSIWHPRKEKQVLKDLEYSNES